MNTVILGIGSNINPEVNIQKMLVILAEKCTVLSRSSLVTTKPIGIEDQPDFVNGAVKLETSLEQEELKTWLKSVEDRLGRDRSLPKFGPRPMDLDIVVWNGTIIDDDYHTRDFLKKAVDELL